MSIIYGNSRLLAKSAAEQFKMRHYFWRDGHWYWATERDAKIYEHLVALGPDPDPAFIEKMLDEGADLSLTRRECGSCAEDVTEWVEWDGFLCRDDEISIFICCRKCLSDAVVTMNAGRSDE